MKKAINRLKTLLVLMLIAITPQTGMAHELFSSAEFKQDAGSPTWYQDFGYFFYTSYNSTTSGKLELVALVAGYSGTDAEVTIPETVMYAGCRFKVVGIDWHWRDHYGNCKKLTIPNSVVEIEQGAFTDVDGITHLTFEDGEKELYCNDSGSLHSQYGVFTYMDGLQEVYVGRELAWNYEEYVEAPFYRNNDGSYFKVTIGPKVKTLHYHTFHHAHVNAVEILDDEAPLRIDSDVFGDCPQIAKWIQNRQIEGDDQPCKESRELKEIKIGGHVTRIPDNEFMNCYNVYSLDLSEAQMLTSIGEHAFEDCDDVTEVVIPKNVTYIGYEAFYDMDDLKKITFQDNASAPIDMTGGFVFYGYDGYSKELQEVYLGRTLQTKSGNENYEFADRSKIEKVTVGPGCTAIPDKLFMNCYNVRTIDMSKATALTSIGEHAFEDCDRVTRIVIPKTVTYLGYEAFYDIDNLAELTLEDGPETLDMMGGAQFRAYDNSNANLRTVYLGRNLRVDVEGYQKDNFYNRRITTVTIGPYVTDIPDKLFYNNPFATITFNAGSGPLSIGKQAFVGDGNTTVTSVVIPTPVSYIGEDAFYDNTSMVTLSLKLAANAFIAENAFDNCSNIYTVIVDPNGQTKMRGDQGNNCFESDVYSKATLSYNNLYSDFIESNEPWKSFQTKDSSYNGKVSFDYNGLTINLTQGDDGIFRYQNSLGELQTLELKDEIAINSPVDFVANVSYNRVITNDKWGTTIYLPFGMPKPEGWKIYTLMQAQTNTTGKVTLTEVETVEPFTPYVVRLTEEYSFPTQERTILSDHRNKVVSSGNYQLIGTIDGLSGDNFIPTETAMMFEKTSGNVGHYRAMLKYTGSEDLSELTGVVGLWEGLGTKAYPYLVSTAEEWESIHNLMMEEATAKMQSATIKTLEGVYFKQTADITTDKGIGITGAAHSVAFAGHYNGGGFTLTCNISNAGEAAAPFYRIYDASIDDLHVAGIINGGIHSAGVAAFVEGTASDDPNSPRTSIRNCRVSADITCSGNQYNDAHGAGFIGHKQGSYTYMDNCLFDGSLTAVSNGKGDIRLGAFIGWGDANKIRIYNAVEHGTYNNATAEQTGFCWAGETNNLDNGLVNDYSIATTLNLPYCRGVNKYYLLQSGTEGVKVAMAETQSRSYALGGYYVTENNNYAFGDSLYINAGKTVKFGLIYDKTWILKDVKAGGYDATETDTEDVYTCSITSVNADALPVITANYALRWDGSGTADDPWLIQDEEDFYCMKTYREAGVDMTGKHFTVMPATYNLAEDVLVDSRMTISGDVTLNTDEGTTLHAPKGIELSKNNKLTLGGSGTLTIDNCDEGFAGIGAVEVGTLVIGSATLNVTGGEGAAGIGGSKNNTYGGFITINGGTVNAVGGSLGAAIGGGQNQYGGINGYGDCGDIVINGGRVTATEGGIGYGNGCNYSTGTLTLRWTDADDFVYTKCQLSNGNITFAKPFVVEGTRTKVTDRLISSSTYKIVPNLRELILYNDQDNADAISEKDGMECDVTIEGLILYKNGLWNTICLPFDVTINGSVLEGAEVRTLGQESYYRPSDQKMELNFSDKKAVIAAGIPYIIKWETGTPVVNPVFESVNVYSGRQTIHSEPVDFTGSYAPTECAANDKSILYINDSNKLLYPTVDTTLGAFNAYFRLNDITADNIDIISNHINLKYDKDSGETTGIDTIGQSDNLQSGHHAVYDLTGRKIANCQLPKGIYIYKGKKKVIK